MAEEQRSSSDVRKDLKALTEQMETEKATYLEAVREHIPGRIDRWVEDAIEAKPEVVVELSKSGQLASLKKRLEHAKGKLPAYVRQFFDSDLDWPHESKEPPDAFEPEKGLMSVRDAFSEILESFGLEVPAGRWSTSYDDLLNEEKSLQSEAMDQSSRSYSQMHGQMYKLESELEDAKHAESAAKAKKLWEKT